MKAMHMYKLCLVVLFSLCLSADAYACACKKLDYFESYNSSDLIFLGKTTEANIKNVSFEVVKSWKGNIKKTLKISQPRGKDCTLYFTDKNKEYLIFAQKQNDGKYRAYRCAGSQEISSKEISKSTKAIKWLDSGKESVGIR